MGESEKNDRIRGMLWGLIVGDCIGSPVQFMNMDSFPKVTEMIPCRYFNTPAGYWTDDGALPYDILQKIFMDALPPDIAICNEYHALIVALCKESCKKSACGEICKKIANFS